MKRLYELIGACLSAAIFSACGGDNSGLYSSTSVAVPNTVRPQSPGSRPLPRVRKNVLETELYSFRALPDGETPLAGLTNVNGTLYGTTWKGGSQNQGTVYSITSSGKETVLHNFAGGGNDGAYPVAGLTNVNGTLYGTTEGGGPNNLGTVFKMATNGAYTQLYAFVSGGSPNDGAYPHAGLTNVGGTVYGTTYEGGASGLGTVFKIATNGAYTQLYNFVGGGDGASPTARLTNVGGTLYGTTEGGASQYEGTVYSITPSGTETVLHHFVGGSNDGAFPNDLTNVGGTLYGTTFRGGSQDEGTVFKMATNGAYTQLHTFVGGSKHGAYPAAGLTNVGGTLYGTTSKGGYENAGTVFKMATNGAYTQLYHFVGGNNDGAYPYGLTKVRRTLYGTTGQGGVSGVGTVFTLSL